MNTNKYFRELALNLQREGFTVGPEADGLLPVKLDGQHLCVAPESGGIRYRKEYVASEARTDAGKSGVITASHTGPQRGPDFDFTGSFNDFASPFPQYPMLSLLRKCYQICYQQLKNCGDCRSF